jgi:plastocyanin
MRRTIFLSAATAAIALSVVVSFLLINGEARGQTTVNVEVGDIYFCSPSFANGICETNVSAGDTVQWNWVGSLPHTVTQCDPGFIICPPPGGFDSGMLTGSGSTFSQTFNTPGTFAYQCNIHGAAMRGRVNVAGAQATPTASAAPTTSPAQTGTAAPTVSVAPGATATRTAAAPAAVPGTGGGEAGGGSSWLLVLAIAGGVLLIASAGTFVLVLRRR